MAEWSNAPVLKTGVLRGTGGSNPSLSAAESCKSKDLQDFFYYNPGVPFKNYYHKSGKDKETGRPIEEDWLYKAKELFGYQEDGHIYHWHLDTIEDYFGVPAYNYLLSHQECYMDDDCPIQRTKAQMRNYLHTFHLKNGRVKFHVYDFRRMISVMA